MTLNSHFVRKSPSFGGTALNGLSWILLQKGSIQGITFISTVILARLLETSAFGLVALTGTFMAFAQMFIDQGFGVAIVQRKDLHPLHLDAVFWMNMTAAFLLLTAGYALADPISRIFQEPDFVPVFRVLLFTLPISAVNLVQRSLLQKKMAFRALAMPNMIGISLGAVIGVSMAFAGMGVWSLVAQTMTVQVVAVPLLWGASDWRPRLRFSLPHFREIFGFSVYVMFSQFIYVLTQQTDRILIGFFLGTSALGIYAVASRLLINLYQTLSQVVGTVFYPMLSERQNDRRAFHDCLQKALRMTSLAIFPMFMGLMLVAEWILPLIYGDKWIQGIPVMQIMAFMYLAYVLFRIVTTGITAAGNPKVILQLHGIDLILHLGLVYMAAQWSIVHVAAAVVLRVYLMFPLYLLALRRMSGYGLTSFARSIYPPAAASLLMILVIVFTRIAFPGAFSTTAIALSITIGLGMIAYGVGIFIAAPRWTRTTLARTTTALKNRIQRIHP